MIIFDDYHDFVIFVSFSLVIGLILVLAWMSTFVTEQPLIATAVIVFQPSSNPISSVGDRNTSNIQPTSRVANTAMSESDSDRDSAISGHSSDSNVLEDDILIEHESENSNTAIPTNSEEIEYREIDGAADSLNTLINLPASPEAETSPCEDDLASCISDSEKFGAIRKRNIQLSKEKVEDGDKQAEIEVSGTIETETNDVLGAIKIKLKFMDETLKLVWGKSTDEVGDFKRTHFKIEMESNCAVRLIFNGKILNHDSSTLGEYGLFHNCVVHCHVSEPLPRTQNANPSVKRNVPAKESENFSLAEYFNPLFIGIFISLWYIRCAYPNIFNNSSTFILVCLTILFLALHYVFSISFNITVGTRSTQLNNSTDGNSRQEQSVDINSLEFVDPHLAGQETDQDTLSGDS